MAITIGKCESNASVLPEGHRTKGCGGSRDGGLQQGWRNTHWPCARATTFSSTCTTGGTHRRRAGSRRQQPPPPPHQHARARSRRTPLRHQRPTAVAPLTTNPHPFCFARYSSPQRAPMDLRLSSHVPRNFTAIGTHLCRPPLSFQGTKRFAEIRGRCRDAFRKKTLQHTTQFEVAFVVCSELRPAPLTTDSRREIDFWKLYEAHPLFL